MNKIVLAILIGLMAVLPASAEAETFRSLEYGFSVDYQKDMIIDAYGTSIGVDLYSPDDANIRISIAAFTDSRLTVADLIKAIESNLASQAKLEVIGEKAKKINATDAVVKDYLQKFQSTSVRHRFVCLKYQNITYRIQCLAPEDKFQRANQMYFESMINSFKVFPVDDSLQENIPGFPVLTPKGIWSSPALADINADGKSEIAIGADDGKLRVIQGDGTDMGGFPATTGGVIISCPAVADISGDGKPDIAVGSNDGKMYAWHANGTAVAGFPATTADPIGSSPAIGDMNADGKREIAAGSQDRGIYAWQANGDVLCGYPIITGFSVLCSPLLADLNGDEALEMVIASKKEEVDTESAIFDTTGVQVSLFTGMLYALDSRGKQLPGFPKSLKVPTLKDMSGSNLVLSSPAVSDLNGDDSPEIVIGAGSNLYAITSSGADMPGYPVKAAGTLVSSFPAIGDVDGDKKPEIAAGAGDGRIYVWKSDGTTLQNFPIQTGGYIQMVTLSDLNGDGKQEIIGGSRDNRVHAYDSLGKMVAGFPKTTLGDVESSPAVGDVDGDKKLELIVGSRDGSIYAWKIAGNNGALDWPMAMQNPAHVWTAPKK
jgi:WD40 repeat protein